MNDHSLRFKGFSAFFWLNVAFVALMAMTLGYTSIFLPAYSDSSQVSLFLNQLRSVRIPINTVLIVWLMIAAIRRFSLSAVLSVGTAFQWIVLMDDYFVIGLHSFEFDSPLATLLQTARPFIAISLSYITLNVFMYERGRRS